MQRLMMSSMRPGVPISTCPPRALKADTSAAGSLRVGNEGHVHVGLACRRVTGTWHVS